jgi:DNA-binding HxlR family transcriptional regulator
MQEDVREVLYRKWAIDILQFLDEEGPKNYSQIEAEFDTSSDVITNRLQQLTDTNLLTRRERSTKDVRYSLTENGEELIVLLEDIQSLLED